MDRLAAYFHWNDRQSLDQAVLIAKVQRIQFSEVKRWAKQEGQAAKYEHFLLALGGKKRKS